MGFAAQVKHLRRRDKDVRAQTHTVITPREEVCDAPYTWRRPRSRPHLPKTYGRKALCLQGFVAMAADDAIAETANTADESFGALTTG
jgi:hypothetical protein